MSNPTTTDPSIFETMNTIMGSKYQIVTDGKDDPVVLAKLPDEDLAPKNTVLDSVANLPTPSPPVEVATAPPKPVEKTNDDYLFQVYLGSLGVVGLFMLFRMIQKSK